MEVKTAAWGTVALVISAFGAIVIYAIEREGMKSDFIKAQAEWSSTKNLLESRNKSLADRKEAFRAMQERVVTITATSERIKLQEERNVKSLNEINQLREEWARTRSAFAKDIDNIRQKTKDAIMPSMILVDATELKAVRFKEMKEKMVILEHSAGIAKIALTNIPKDWVGRLALGWNPKLSAELSGKPDEVEPVAASAPPEKTPEMVQQEHRESVKRAGLSDAEQKIKTLERKISEVDRARLMQFNAAEEYSRKHSLAQQKGNSSNYGVKRDEASRAATALGNQIEAIQTQIAKLQEEIYQKSL